MKRFLILFLLVPFFSFADGEYYESLREIQRLQSLGNGYLNYLVNIYYGLDSIDNYLGSIQGDSTVIRSDVRTIKSTLSDISDDVSSLATESTLSDISDYVSSLAKETTLSSISTSLSGISSDISSILSNFPSVDDLAKESTLSSIYDSLGDNIGSDVDSIDSSLSSIKSFFTQNYSSVFFNDFHSLVDKSTSPFYSHRSATIGNARNVYYYYNPTDKNYSTRTVSFVDQSGRDLTTTLFNIALQLSTIDQSSNTLLLHTNLQLDDILDALDSLDNLSFIQSSLGNVATSADIQAAVELLGTISSDVSSILAKMDESSSDDDDEDEDPWIEFREKYLTLFDNQPIPTYEIDYALIGWESNSVPTKATLTAQSGDFFSLCLGFLIDANKVAASQSIFLKHILDYLPQLKPPESKDTTEDENRVNGQITDVSGQISTLNQTFNYENLIFKEESVDFFDHDTITGQFDDESLPANVTIVIPPIFTFQTQVFTIPTAGFADFFDYTRAFCAVLYYVLLCGFIWFVFKCFLLCCSKFGKVIGFVLQW